MKNNKFRNKLLFLGIILILGYVFGFLSGKYIMPNYIPHNSQISNIKCFTKDNDYIKLNIKVDYDNPNKVSEFYIKNAINESSSYVIRYFDKTDLIYEVDKNEIIALITEEIYNRTNQYGLIINQVDIKMEE